MRRRTGERTGREMEKRVGKTVKINKTVKMNKTAKMDKTGWLLMIAVVSVFLAACGSSEQTGKDGDDGTSGKPGIEVTSTTVPAGENVSNITPAGAASQETSSQAPQSPETAVTGEISPTVVPQTGISSGYNTNLETTRGRILYYDGYTYVTFGYNIVLNDESGKDIWQAQNSIWRIADDKSAEPEEVYSSSTVIEGMVAYDGKIYFIEETMSQAEMPETAEWGVGVATGQSYRRKMDRTLCWISPDGSTSGKLECDALNQMESLLKIWQYLQDDNMLYFCTRTGCFAFDLATGAARNDILEGKLAVQEGERYHLLAANGGYLYFLKMDYITDGERMPGYELQNGIWRAKADGSGMELLARIDTDEINDMIRSVMCATDKYFYYGMEEGVKAIEIESGDVFMIIDSEDFCDDEERLLNVTEDGIYYLMDADLYFCEPDGKNARCLVSDRNPDNKKEMIALCGDWIFYGDRYFEKCYRMKREAKSFSGGEIPFWK